MAPDFVAEHAARRQRQGQLQAPEAHCFEAAAGQQEDDKTRQGDQQRAAVVAEQATQAWVAPGQQEEQQPHPPPGGKPEQVEQQVGEPGTEAPTRIGDAFHHGRVRPARVAALETPQDER
jgi:hypothetical protein